MFRISCFSTELKEGMNASQSSLLFGICRLWQWIEDAMLHGLLL